MNSETVQVRFCGEEFSLPISMYDTLRDLVTSRAFLDVTTVSPNRLAFFRVNGEFVQDDCLLVPGDVIELDTTTEKTVIRPKDVIKKLRNMVGLRWDKHGGDHDKWRTAKGNLVVFPRHASDLKRGTLKSILKQAGLDMSISEFIAL